MLRGNCELSAWTHPLPEVPSATHWHHMGQIPPFPPKAVNLQVCSRINSHSLSLQIPVCQSPPENRILKRSRLVAEGQAGPQAPCSVHRPSITRSAQHLPHGWAQVPADEAALGGSQALHKATALVPFKLPCVFQGTPAPASLRCRDDAGAPVLGGLGCYQGEPSGSAARGPRPAGTEVVLTVMVTFTRGPRVWCPLEAAVKGFLFK